MQYHHKRWIILGVLLVGCLSVFAAGRKFPKLDEFQNVEIEKITAKGISISHKNGGALLTEQNLSEASKSLLQDELAEVRRLQEKAKEQEEALVKKHSEEVATALENAQKESSATQALVILTAAQKYKLAPQYDQLLQAIKLQQEEVAKEQKQAVAHAMELYKQGKLDACVNEMLPLAQQGNAEAQFNMAIICGEKYKQSTEEKRGQRTFKKKGDKKLLQESITWYRKSIAKGYLPAMYNLAGVYRSGADGEMPKNLSQAFSLLKNAADGGMKEAQYNLAMMYFEGEGTTKDLKKAADYLMKSAEAGLDSAQYEMGRQLEAEIGLENLGSFWGDVTRSNPMKIGKGRSKDSAPISKEEIAQNREKILSWFRKAAEQGHAQSMLQMARYSGTLEEAREWTQKAGKADPAIAANIAKRDTRQPFNRRHFVAGRFTAGTGDSPTYHQCNGGRSVFG